MKDQEASEGETSEHKTGERKAVVHDLGYRRYRGARRSQATRFQVIVRNLLSMSWSGWWRYKLPLALASCSMAVIAGAIYMSRNEIFNRGGQGEMIHQMADVLIPQSFTYLGWAALLVCMTVLASAISRDLRAGAFEFYFSRPVRPIDYTLGKVIGAFLLLAPILLVGPTLLTIFRLAISGDTEQIVSTLPWIPKAMLVGAVASLAHGCVALAFGSFTGNSRYAIAGYAAFMLILGGIIRTIAYTTQTPVVAALDLNASIMGLSSSLFDVDFLFGVETVSLPYAVIGISFYIAASIIIIVSRVQYAQKAGMGGG